MYAIKEFIGSDRAQGSQKKRGFSIHFKLLSSPIQEAPLDLVGRDRHLEASGSFTSMIGGLVLR